MLAALEVRPTSRVWLQVAVGRTSFDRLRLGTRPKTPEPASALRAAFLGPRARKLAQQPRAAGLRFGQQRQHTLGDHRHNFLGRIPFDSERSMEQYAEQLNLSLEARLGLAQKRIGQEEADQQRTEGVGEFLGR